MQTQAIRIEQTGEPQVMKLVTVDVPPPADDEITVRQHAIGLNYIDIYFRKGVYQHPLPHGLGFEAAGTVEAVGSKVRGLKVGDRVAYGQSDIGAYAGLRNLPAWRVAKVPKGISDEQAAAIMLKGLTVQYLFRYIYRLQGGETILFHAAAGGVGLIACQWARALGVRLIGTVSSPEKARLALEHGAWRVIDYTREDVPQRVLELTRGRKVPVVFDSVGQATWLASLDCLQRHGLMVSFGNASGPVQGVNLGILAAKGSLYVTRPNSALYLDSGKQVRTASRDLFAMVQAGHIQPVIGQRYALSDVAQAHEALAARRTTGSTLLIPD